MIRRTLHLPSFALLFLDVIAGPSVPFYDEDDMKYCLPITHCIKTTYVLPHICTCIASLYRIDFSFSRGISGMCCRLSAFCFIVLLPRPRCRRRALGTPTFGRVSSRLHSGTVTSRRTPFQTHFPTRGRPTTRYRSIAPDRR